MNRDNHEASVARRPFAAAASFVLLAYGLSWAIEIPAALKTYGVLQLHVSNGLQTLAQLTPALAALLTAGWFHGRRAITTILASLVRVRVSFRWYAFALLLPPATQAVAILLYRISGHDLPAFGPWYEVPLLTAALALFSMGEELGWRGFLLPNLMENNSLLAATGWIALLWGFWHLPFYLARNSEGESTGLMYLLFLAGIFPVSAFLTLLYSRTRSVLLCTLMHGALNAGAAHWFGPLPQGTLLAVGIWTVVLWVTAIPIFLALANAGKRQVLSTNQRS